MSEWFARAGGLRFECTMCGRCCSGPPGYVIVNDEEIRVLAARLGVDEGTFRARYTTDTHLGPSLIEKQTEHGLDCIFLDREAVPGKAVCGVYEDRPGQCRTWPFWASNLQSEKHWRVAGRTCPGMGRGRLYPPESIRILRDRGM